MHAFLSSGLGRLAGYDPANNEKTDVLNAAYGTIAAAAAASFALINHKRKSTHPHPQVLDPQLMFHEEKGITKVVPKIGGGAGEIPRSKQNRKFTLKEVAAHNTIDDCWIVVDERAYDVTSFVHKHPGGSGLLARMAGKDCTDVFANYHSLRVYKHMLPQYFVGEVTDVELYPHVRDFREIRQELLRQGLFETDMRYYMVLGTWLLTLFCTSIAFSLYSSTAWGRMGGAALMGIFWQQLAGLGHDLGHSGVTHRFKTDHMVGSVLASLMGLSTCWWKRDHNTHHVCCNAIEHDPTLQHMPLLAMSPVQFAEPFWDTYHSKVVGMDGICRFLVSFQHIFFYPAMAFGRFNLYIQGILFLLFRPDKAHFPKVEGVAIAAFFGWVSAVALSMPTYTESLGWVLVSHAVAGILHVQIVLSHWSMEIYSGDAYTGKDDEWYITQMRTTMNVDTPPWLDWVHIGLQFQIEHHLYPRLPRHNLRKARELVRAVCAKHSLHYHEVGFFEGNLEMWRTLRATAMEARSTKRGDHGFFESAIWQGMNLAG